MTRQLAKSEPLLTRFGDVFVILSATLLSLAAGAWLISQAGLELSSALLAALGIYCALLLLHLLVRRSFSEAGHPGAGARAREDDRGGHWHSEAAGDGFSAMLADRGADAADFDMPPPAEAPHRAGPGHWPEPLPMPASMPALGRDLDRDLGGDEAAGAEADHPASAAAHDPFTFRPSRAAYFEDEPTEDQRLLDDPAAAALAGPEAAPAQPEMSVEFIQGLIKKLAEEINSGPSPARDGGSPEAQPDHAADAMIGRSVAALESTARSMRGAAEPPQASGSGFGAAGAGAGPTRGKAGRRSAKAAAPPQLDPRLARIAEAIAAERIEVLLQPIHALAENRPRHYEVSVRLRLSDGAALEQDEFARLALGTGLMPRLDAHRMLKAARVARRLSERGRQGSVLTALAGESLADGEFLDAAALQPGSDGRVNLVLAFAQSDVRTFTPVHAEALGTMAASGFRFALEDVADLDMDFGRLKAMGFEFVKLDQQVFLEGLPASSGRIPASDICRHLAEFGLTLIVGGIQDDWLLARILGFGVLLGHGTLFGGPKLVKPEIVSDRGSAAA